MSWSQRSLANCVDIEIEVEHDRHVHTHATLALQAGVHPKIVSERLGHGDVGVTLNTYSHAIPALEEEAAARVAALVFGA